MMQRSGDPVPSISEADATGGIAEMYEDIRVTLGIPLVNLIWRNLAAVPGGLKWAWTTMKPLYAQGAVYAEAVALRNGQNLPTLPRLPRAALRAVGVDTAAEEAITEVLHSYDQGNPLNIVTFSALWARLRNEIGADVPIQSGQVPAASSAIRPLPELMNLDEMDSNTSELVIAVNRLGAGDFEHILVSMPRNLAHWPGFLTLYWMIVAPYDADERLAGFIDAVLEDGRRRGLRLVRMLGDTQLPTQETREGVEESLATLVPGAMGRMIPVVSLIKRSMPEHT